MKDDFVDDPLKPRFVHFVFARPDEIRRDRFAGLVDEAVAAWDVATGSATDASHGVRDLTIELLEPVTEPATIRVDVWVERLSATSCTWGFLCSSADGNLPYARGERTSWSLPFHTKQETLRRDLPAYA